VGVIGGTVYVIRYARISFPWRTTATIYFAAAISVTPIAYCFAQSQLGFIMLAGSVATGAILYVLLLVISGEIGKGDFGVLKEAFLAKVYPPELVETGDLA
jgi:hypothetical protein